MATRYKMKGRIYVLKLESEYEGYKVKNKWEDQAFYVCLFDSEGGLLQDRIRKEGVIYKDRMTGDKIELGGDIIFCLYLKKGNRK
jgi:hypothetical protein